MIDVQQFRADVVRYALQHTRTWSPAAERLMMGTAAVESGFRSIRQLGNGPALGFFQVEPQTRNDIHVHYLAFHQSMKERVADLQIPSLPLDRQLIVNLAYSTAIARLVYFRRPEPLPEAEDDKGLAAYWKQHYNTPLGKGTEAKFLKALRKHGL